MATSKIKATLHVRTTDTITGTVNEYGWISIAGTIPDSAVPLALCNINPGDIRIYSFVYFGAWYVCVNKSSGTSLSFCIRYLM